MKANTALDQALDRTATLLEQRERGIGLVAVVLAQLRAWGCNPPGSVERLTDALALLTFTQAELRAAHSLNAELEEAMR